MQTLRYTTVDKSTWGDGPWQSEPDKMQWQDEATGLPCLIVRGPVGALCGYVGIAPDHPAYGLSYDGTPDNEHRAHIKAVWDHMRTGFKHYDGSAEMHEAVRDSIMSMPEPPAVVPGIGECVAELEAHGGLTYSGCCQGDICHVPESNQPDNVWWFGFDCAHAWDLCPLMEKTYREVAAKTPHIPKPDLLVAYEREHPDIYRDIPYVQAEVAGLAKQLAEIASKASPAG